MLKLTGQTEDGSPAISLVLVEANLVRLRAGQPIEITIGLEHQNVNGGRRRTFLTLAIGYAATHADGVESLRATGLYSGEFMDQVLEQARAADAKGADVADHTVEAFDA